MLYLILNALYPKRFAAYRSHIRSAAIAGNRSPLEVCVLLKEGVYYCRGLDKWMARAYTPQLRDEYHTKR